MNDKCVIDALVKIASYQRGGVVVTGQDSGDRDEMIGAAREALRQIGYDIRQRPIVKRGI